MISTGIRFGEGFDKPTILKLMDAIQSEYEYDLLVLGSSPGGIACAREAASAGRKVALVRWITYSPAEEEGYDEDMGQLDEVLSQEHITADFGEDATQQVLGARQMKASRLSISKSKSITGSIKMSGTGKSGKKGIWSRKVRQSRLDLNNELYRRGKEGRKLMLKAATCQKSFLEATRYGWRINLPLQKPTINWKKMSEFIMDYMMQENWNLMNTLAQEGVEVIDGKPSFVNSHTVKVQPPEEKDYNVTAAVILSAPLSNYVLPDDVPGAADLGITCDDFVRLSEPPGKTLIVGCTPEGLECAGILACLQIPVSIVYRSEFLKGYDSAMSTLVLNNLKANGVVCIEKTSLVSIRLTRKGKLLTDFISNEFSDITEETSNLMESTHIKEDEFDTVIFATRRSLSLDFLNLSSAGVELDPTEHKICTTQEDASMVPSIYAIGDSVAFRPQSFEISETAGRLLGKRLFWDKTEVMDYSMLPYVLMTPIEYAFIGLSEDGAVRRFGKECIDVFQGEFTPIEYVWSQPGDKCLIKVIVFKSKNQIIGLHMFGPEAGEVIQGFAGAIKLGMTVDQLQAIVCVSATKAQEIIKLKRVQAVKSGEVI